MYREPLIIDYCHIISCYVSPDMKTTKARFMIYHFRDDNPRAKKQNAENEKIYMKLRKIINDKGWYFTDDLRSMDE